MSNYQTFIAGFCFVSFLFTLYLLLAEAMDHDSEIALKKLELAELRSHLEAKEKYNELNKNTYEKSARILSSS